MYQNNCSVAILFSAELILSRLGLLDILQEEMVRLEEQQAFYEAEKKPASQPAIIFSQPREHCKRKEYEDREHLQTEQQKDLGRGRVHMTDEEQPRHSSQTGGGNNVQGFHSSTEQSQTEAGVQNNYTVSNEHEAKSISGEQATCSRSDGQEAKFGSGEEKTKSVAREKEIQLESGETNESFVIASPASISALLNSTVHSEDSSFDVSVLKTPENFHQRFQKGKGKGRGKNTRNIVPLKPASGLFSRLGGTKPCHDRKDVGDEENGSMLSRHIESTSSGICTETADNCESPAEGAEKDESLQEASTQLRSANKSDSSAPIQGRQANKQKQSEWETGPKCSTPHGKPTISRVKDNKKGKSRTQSEDFNVSPIKNLNTGPDETIKEVNSKENSPNMGGSHMKAISGKENSPSISNVNASSSLSLSSPDTSKVSNKTLQKLSKFMFKESNAGTNVSSNSKDKENLPTVPQENAPVAQDSAGNGDICSQNNDSVDELSIALSVDTLEDSDIVEHSQNRANKRKLDRVESVSSQPCKVRNLDDSDNSSKKVESDRVTEGTQDKTKSGASTFHDKSKSDANTFQDKTKSGASASTCKLPWQQDSQSPALTKFPWQKSSSTFSSPKVHSEQKSNPASNVIHVSQPSMNSTAEVTGSTASQNSPTKNTKHNKYNNPPNKFPWQQKKSEVSPKLTKKFPWQKPEQSPALPSKFPWQQGKNVSNSPNLLPHVSEQNSTISSSPGISCATGTAKKSSIFSTGDDDLGDLDLDL